jgi:predicted nuclease of predicted toxin-antitoxin system
MREYAAREGFVIVTKDSDFSDLCILLGFPPKVIWIRRGNCSSADIEAILRDHNPDIEALGPDEVIGILTLF